MSSSWPIVFMGTPEIAAVTLQILSDGSDPVVGVVTQPDRPTGRGQQSRPSPVRRMAERRGIPVITPIKIRDSGFLEALRSWNPQLIVVVAFGRILPKSILDVSPRGCLNVHYSLLPKYRGAAPVTWTIINGEEKSGVTTMQLVEQLDAGPIYLQEEIPLDEHETTGSLQAKLAPLGAQLLLKTISGLKGNSLPAHDQDETCATFAPMIKKEDGLVDWTLPALTIERCVRAFTPWPSAYTHSNGKLLKIHRAIPIQTNRSGTPGEIVRADSGGFWVATGDGTLSLEEVQLENRKRVPGVEFIKGARIAAGDHL
jgi:methionyl-tRNA formyltransferase